MSPAFLVKYVTGKRQITKSIDGKNYMQKNNTSVFMFVCTMILYEYMKSLRNGVNNLFDNMQMKLKYIGSFTMVLFI